MVHSDLEANPPAWDQIEKFELDEPFWTMVESAFGYGEDSPALQNLLIRLLVSDYAHHLAKELHPVRCSTSNCHVPALLMPWSAWLNGETAAARAAATACWRLRSGRACIFWIIFTAVKSKNF